MDHIKEMFVAADHSLTEKVGLVLCSVLSLLTISNHLNTNKAKEKFH